MNNVGGCCCFSGGHHFKSVSFGLPAGSAFLPEPYYHVKAGVLQILRLGVPLAAITDNCNFFSLQ